MSKFILAFQKHSIKWRIGFVLTCMLCVWSTGYAAFEYRQPLLEMVVGNKLTKRVDGVPVAISIQTQQTIQRIVDTNPVIAGVNVSFAYFPTNTRRSVYATFNQRDIAREMDRISGLAYPLFTDDSFQNSRLVNLINGEFICSPLNKHALLTMPALTRDINFTCSMPIPSGLSDFTGWVNFYLKDEPTQEQQDYIRHQAKSLVGDLYKKEVL